MLNKIKQLKNHEDKFTQWEREFLGSIEDYFNKKGRVSPAQDQVIKRMLDKYSDDNMKKLDDWKKSWTPEKQRIFDICVRYYKQAGYFSHVIDKVAKNSDYIPNEKTFVKMCENKYAKKVLAVCDSKPVWPIGGVATLRMTLKYNDPRPHDGSKLYNARLDARSLKNKPVMILGIDDKLDTHRYYHVALMTDPAINFDIREDKMKKFKQ